MTALNALAIALALLLLGDFLTTEYSLYRWPGRAFESGRGTLALADWLHKTFPDMRGTIDLHLSLLAGLLFPLAVVAGIWHYAPPFVASFAFVVGIVYQADIDFGNVKVIRDLS